MHWLQAKVVEGFILLNQYNAPGLASVCPGASWWWMRSVCLDEIIVTVACQTCQVVYN